MLSFSAKDVMTSFLIAAALVVLIFSAALSAQLSGTSSMTKKSGPLPAPDVTGLGELQKMLVFAQRNINEGDFESALENLNEAERLSAGDARVHEMLGITYDSLRDSERAFGYYKSSGELYFRSGNLHKAWRLLGWMRTTAVSPEYISDVTVFEEMLLKRQGVIKGVAGNSSSNARQ